MSEKSNFETMSSEQVLFDMYVKTANVICSLDKDILAGNTKLIDNMKFEDDRIVPFEAVMFAANNAGTLIAMLGMNYKNTRDIFMNALEEEVGVDDMTLSERNAFRVKTQSESLRYSKYTIKLGVSNFNNKTLSYATSACHASFEKTHKRPLLRKLFTTLETASSEDKMMLTVIMSNYVYLLRLFSNNAVFLNQLSDIIDDFEYEYNIVR